MKNPRCEIWKVSYSTGFTLTICIGTNPRQFFFSEWENNFYPSTACHVIQWRDFIPSNFINTSAFISQPDASHKFSEQVYWLHGPCLKAKNIICIIFLIAEKQNTANFLLTFQVCCKFVTNVSVNIALQKLGFILLQYRTGFSPCCCVFWGAVSPIIHFTFAFHSTTGCSSLTSLCLLYTGSGDDKLIRCCHHNCDWLLQKHVCIHIVDIIFRIFPTYTKKKKKDKYKCRSVSSKEDQTRSWSLCCEKKNLKRSE